MGINLGLDFRDGKDGCFGGGDGGGCWGVFGFWEWRPGLGFDVGEFGFFLFGQDEYGGHVW